MYNAYCTWNGAHCTPCFLIPLATTLNVEQGHYEYNELQAKYYQIHPLNLTIPGIELQKRKQRETVSLAFSSSSEFFFHLDNAFYVSFAQCRLQTVKCTFLKDLSLAYCLDDIHSRTSLAVWLFAAFISRCLEQVLSKCQFVGSSHFYILPQESPKVG